VTPESLTTEVESILRRHGVALPEKEENAPNLGVLTITVGLSTNDIAYSLSVIATFSEMAMVRRTGVERSVDVWKASTPWPTA